MDRSAIFDPLGIEQFLLQGTQSTSLRSPGVVETLANFSVGSPNRRHLLSLLIERIYGTSHHINKMEQELKKKQQLCSPEGAVKLIVDLRVPRRRYLVIYKGLSPHFVNVSATAHGVRYKAPPLCTNKCHWSNRTTNYNLQPTPTTDYTPGTKPRTTNHKPPSREGQHPTKSGGTGLARPANPVAREH